MLNKAILMGRLTRDPELRYTQNNTPVVTFSIAVDRNYSGRGTERQTDFIDIVAWRSTAEFVSKWFTKGMMIIVDGSIQSRRWQDKDGNNRTTIEVVAANVAFGETKRAREAAGAAPSTAEYTPPPPQPPTYPKPERPAQQNMFHPGVDADNDDFTDITDEDGEVPF